MCDKNMIDHDHPMLFIEGNVGVGKSTFLRFLHDQLGEHVFYEPNELWQDVDGNNLLEQFFLDQNRWAYTLQTYILQTRVDQMIQADRELCQKVCLVERSIFSGRYCFAQVAKDIGTMNNLEWCLYTKMWDREVVKIQRQPAGFIYLRTSAQNCYDRIMSRARPEEQPITLDYLQRLEEKHENWFIKKEGVVSSLAAVPVLVLDFSPNVTIDTALQAKYMKLISEFIEQVRSKKIKNRSRINIYMLKP